MFRFGQNSLRELEGVDDRLQAVCHRALELTEVDFSVHDGLRTVEEQKELVRSGASQTMQSNHLTGRAVDLVPYVNGRMRWEWGPIYKICEAVRQAAKEHNVNLTWGAAWDASLTDSLDPPSLLAEQYTDRRRAQGKRAFLDGPHFEMRA